MYCSKCGKEIRDDAVVCIHCGCAVEKGCCISGISKEWLTTLLLCIFFGGLGVHRFYNRRILSGILQLITLGGFGIWWAIDLIMIICGTFKNNEGKAIER